VPCFPESRHVLMPSNLGRTRLICSRWMVRTSVRGARRGHYWVQAATWACRQTPEISLVSFPSFRRNWATGEVSGAMLYTFLTRRLSTTPVNSRESNGALTAFSGGALQPSFWLGVLPEAR